MRTRVAIFLCIFFVFIYSRNNWAQSVYVPLNHTVYRFIERFEAKGILQNALVGTKPLSRILVAELLNDVRKSNDMGKLLSRVDTDLLKFYEEEFREEIEQINPSADIQQPESPGWLKGVHQKLFPNIFYKNGRNLLEIKHDDFSIFADIIAHQDNALTNVDTLGSLDEVYRYTTGVRIRGNVGDKIGFFVDARNTKEWGSRNYPEGNDISTPGLGWVSNRVTHQYHDETIAYIIFRISRFEVEFGKNLNRWGPGFRSGLMLSDNATSYDLVKLKTKIWKLTFSHLFASLVQFPRIVEQEFDEDARGKRKFARKYLASHRLELNLYDGVNIGLQESVVYGQREIELAYLNPVMFLRSAEHFLGDQDNALMGLDVSLNIIDGWKWYGELLIDDVFVKRLGTKWWGNKFGYLAGILWTDPLGILNASFRTEYSRIKPFVYTHKFPINVYTQFNTGLGHTLLPNSDEWYIAFNQHLTRNFFYTADFMYSRHGVNTPDRNNGGDINRPLPNVGDEYIGFLEGDIEKVKRLRLKVSYEILRNLFFTTEMAFQSGSDFRINGIPGRDFDSKRFFVSIGLNQ